MTARRRWTWRLLLAVLAYGASWAGLSALDDDPDPLRLALVVGLLVCAGALMVDSATVVAASWPVHPAPTTGLGRADPRTAAYIRLIEGHLTAAEPDRALRDRLRTLTDQVLRVRTDLELADPRADEVLGPQLEDVLKGPVRRLRVEEINRCLRRIEEL
jgi:hypothetical protein